ncbi:MAG: KaiC/GvpD/RAD55 family RecA-like ATPase [Enterobacterales bacterium]|jgi:KaiC/GvpD/RAD55 family RecA-like ATPase
MYPNELEISKETQLEKIRENNKVYFNTGFNFLNQHNGIRPNKMHLLVAPTHVGKSTLTNSLISSIIENNEDVKILLYLTEETVEDFKGAISSMNANLEGFNKCVRVMVEDKKMSEEGIRDILEEAIIHFDFDLVFFDNITTSKIYMEKTSDKQAEVSLWLKDLLKATTLFLIAHTNGNNYNSELLDETHIRGSKTITNIAEFLYVMQPIRVNEQMFQYVRILKSRGQPTLNNFFRLAYSHSTRTITHDKPIDFDDFKAVFKLRNKL